NCACRPCRDDGAADCGAPNKCLEEAIKFLNCLHEKWDPRIQVHQTIPDLSEEQSSDNTEALEEDEPVIFDPKIHLSKRLDWFRILGEDPSTSPAHQMAPVDEEGDPWNETVYIGCSHHIDEDGEHCSFGSVWYAESDERSRRVPVLRKLASKEGGAAAAILYAIQSAPREVALDLKIHLKTLIKNLTTDLIKTRMPTGPEPKTVNSSEH
ncbi:hypothetical protein B0H14DRAFT_2410293, partial [Mycena olivaceomarginata]